MPDFACDNADLSFPLMGKVSGECRTEGVNPGFSREHLAPTPTAGHAPGTSPIKGEEVQK